MKSPNDPTWQSEEETVWYRKIEDEIAAEAQAGAEPDSTTKAATEKPEKELKAGSAETGGEKADDELALRTLLWRRHGCSVMALYGDDGELQCAKCHIDFKRMSAEDISTRFVKLGFQKLAESREPEKLNNAHNYPVFFPQPGGLSEWVTSDGKSWHNGEAAKKHEVALAESSLSSPPPDVYEILRWFVAKSNHEGFCGQCPPVNKGTTCKCDWPEMKKRAGNALNQAQGK